MAHGHPSVRLPAYLSNYSPQGLENRRLCPMNVLDRPLLAVRGVVRGPRLERLYL